MHDARMVRALGGDLDASKYATKELAFLEQEGKKKVGQPPPPTKQKTKKKKKLHKIRCHYDLGFTCPCSKQST